MLGGVEQDEGLVLVDGVAMLLELEPPQIAPQGVEMRDDHVGLDYDGLALLAGRRDLLGYGSLSGRELLAGGGRGNGARYGLVSLFGDGRRPRGLPVPLPAVDQQEHREREHEKEYEAL